METYKLLNKIKPKKIDPKYYSVVLSAGQGDKITNQYLWAGVAYTLEEALLEAKAEMVKQNMTANAFHLQMFRDMPARKVIDDMTSMEIKIEKFNTEKAKLMKQIIDKQDGKLLQENLAKFNVEELGYLKDKLGL